MKYFLLVVSPSCFAFSGHHPSPRVAIGGGGGGGSGQRNAKARSVSALAKLLVSCTFTESSLARLDHSPCAAPSCFSRDGDRPCPFLANRINCGSRNSATIWPMLLSSFPRRVARRFVLGHNAAPSFIFVVLHFPLPPPLRCAARFLS